MQFRVRQNVKRPVHPKDGVFSQSGCLRVITGEIPCLMGEQPLHPLHNGKIHIRVLAFQSPESVFGLTELLIYAQLVNPVDIAARGKVELHLLDGVVPVRGDIQAPGETVALAVVGNEREISALHAVNRHGSHDVILVI